MGPLRTCSSDTELKCSSGRRWFSVFKLKCINVVVALVSLALLHTYCICPHIKCRRQSIQSVITLLSRSLMMLSLQMQQQKERQIYRISGHNEHTLQRMPLAGRFVCNLGYKPHQGHLSRCMQPALRDEYPASY